MEKPRDSHIPKGDRLFLFQESSLAHSLSSNREVWRSFLLPCWHFDWLSCVGSHSSYEIVLATMSLSQNFTALFSTPSSVMVLTPLRVGWVATDDSSTAVHTVSCSWHFNMLKVSMLTMTHCKKELFFAKVESNTEIRV